MPCNDWPQMSSQEHQLSNELSQARTQEDFFKAALCAALNALLESHRDTRSPSAGWPDVYDLLDYKEAGISKDALEQWHQRHLLLDQYRKDREEREKQAVAKEQRQREERERLQASAKAKLTSEEWVALGMADDDEEDTWGL